jgi:hypothetical protein
VKVYKDAPVPWLRARNRRTQTSSPPVYCTGGPVRGLLPHSFYMYKPFLTSFFNLSNKKISDNFPISNDVFFPASI